MDKVLLSTRQPQRKLLTIAKFERLPKPKQTKQVDFFLAQTASIIKMVILEKAYLFNVKPKKIC